MQHMHSLLKPGGHLAGVLFNVEFEKEGPPFGEKNQTIKTDETLVSHYC